MHGQQNIKKERFFSRIKAIQSFLLLRTEGCSSLLRLWAANSTTHCVIRMSTHRVVLPSETVRTCDVAVDQVHTTEGIRFLTVESQFPAFCTNDARTARHDPWPEPDQSRYTHTQNISDALWPVARSRTFCLANCNSVSTACYLPVHPLLVLIILNENLILSGVEVSDFTYSRVCWPPAQRPMWKTTYFRLFSYSLFDVLHWQRFEQRAPFVQQTSWSIAPTGGCRGEHC
jgi:hypothetical protein